MLPLSRHLTLRRILLSVLVTCFSFSASAERGITTTEVWTRTAAYNGPKDKVVPEGTGFEILGTESSWTKVRMDDGKIRYIFSQYIQNVTAVPNKFAVATTGVNFRAGPGTNHRVLAGVGEGEAVHVLGQSGNWTQVQLTDGRKGYIYSRYLAAGTAGTEGGNVDCTSGNCPQPSPVQTTENNVQEVMTVVNAAGTKSQCMMNALIREMKDNVIPNHLWSVEKRRLSSATFKGACALAIRIGLQKSGAWNGGSLGHARDMALGGSVGMENIIKPGMTPESAPAGTILQYGPARVSGCSGAGSTYGHVEIKESNSSYIYDGVARNNIQKKFGANCRPLIGVYRFKETCPNCKTSMRNKCGV